MHGFPAFTSVDWFDEAPLPLGVRAGFTSVHGGSSTGEYRSLNLGFHVGDDARHVQANRAALEHCLGQRIVWMVQVHGKTVARAAQARVRCGFLDVGEADALIIERDQAGAVMVADCVPLILVARSGERGAVVHVGRAGLDLAIAPAVLDALGGDALAIMGPSICGRCYEVPRALADEIGGRWPGSRSTTTAGTPGLDIAAGLEAQLRAAGVVDVHRSPVCTYESEHHYSHRRATHAGKNTGRFVGVLAIGDTPTPVV